MTQWNPQPPRISSLSQCDNSLDFLPLAAWPEGLPAVAINQVLIAGFHQEIVFNHSIPQEQPEKIAALFRSVHSDLSFTEMARLIKAAGVKHPWLPLDLIIQKYGWLANDAFYKTAKLIVETPIGFQNWCAEKKIGPMDLSPLASAGSLNLNPLFLDILNLQASKSTGSKILELAIELMLMGKAYGDISASHLTGKENPGREYLEIWVSKLHTLRYPQSAERDTLEKDQMTSLPWPGMSQAKWTRQGDKTGVELKLFVSQPSDLKKYLQSLEKVQSLLEDLKPGTEH